MIIVYQPFRRDLSEPPTYLWSRFLLEKLISAKQEIPRIVWNPNVR